jgi:acetyl/propionyl-CoA carboxylase alpha subunit
LFQNKSGELFLTASKQYFCGWYKLKYQHMYKVSIADKWNAEISFEENQVWMNGEQVEWSDEKLDDNRYSILFGKQSFVAELVDEDQENKKLTIRINGTDYVVSVLEPMDQVLEEMGINYGKYKKINEIRAPMPGLVLKILVTPGQLVKGGDPIVVLEAMKMENIFKASSDAVVKEIKVVEKRAVEKGEVLVTLE